MEKSEQNRKIFDNTYLSNPLTKQKFGHFVMEQHNLKIVIEYRGRHKKGIIILNATEVSLHQKFMYKWPKCILYNCGKLKLMKISQLLHFSGF